MQRTKTFRASRDGGDITRRLVSRWIQCFDPIPGAEGWQLSNPPIFQLAALRASMEIFDEATMPAIRKKSEQLTGYLEFLLDRLPAGFCEIITPREPQRRGSQLSLRIKKDAKGLGRESWPPTG